MDRDKTTGQSEQDDGGDEQTVVATHEQINASGMVAELKKLASSGSTLAEHRGTSQGTLKPQNNV